jgi:hypothetical protein
MVTRLLLFALVVSGSLSTGQQSDRQTAEFRTSELRLLVGNEYDHGAGLTGYIGIWKLTSIHEPENLFVPKYAGFITHRTRATVTKASESEVVIQHFDPEGRPFIRQTIRVVEPYYFDCTFTRKAIGSETSFAAASYINGPQDPGIYVLDPKMQWQRHYDVEHGKAASILPAGMPIPTVEKVPNSPYPLGTAHFWDSFSSLRYHPSYALFYGRFRDMVLVHMFPPRCSVIPFMSPSGGGPRADGHGMNPAWDWRVDGVRETTSEREHRFTLRVIYKKYVDDGDIVKEYRRWVESLQMAQ